MLLCEFDQDGALVAKIGALTNQLKKDRDEGKIGDDFTLDQLQQYFQKYDVILDANDLYNMIKVPPLKNFIKNIQGDDVIFVGQEENTHEKPQGTDGEKVVKQMAQRAMKI
jgi:FMN-dependent NADH-azoreductase